ncbi:hypothetical protein NVP1244A_139 [Vibrio phage 1.244.A._10N.261.54.C3]|nr:hypothetical protein NVP1244A_139 [Vibrio phage 1.244.A._10N.261.54.C3]AUR98767.1 hypothetical protein NVP1255O_139 [Vibrio phage 1.255.O._10N.286.45.F1]
MKTEYPPRKLEIGHQFFNGIDNEGVIAMFNSMYDFQAGVNYWFEFRDRPIVARYSIERMCFEFYVCDERDWDAVLTSGCMEAEYRDNGKPLNAQQALESRVTQRLHNNEKTLEELQKSPRVMSLVNMLHDSRTINWSDIGIRKNAAIIEDVCRYYTALGYKVNHTLSNNWVNERTFIEIDYGFINDMGALKTLNS